MMNFSEYAPMISSIAVLIDIFLLLFVLLTTKKTKTTIYFLVTLGGIFFWHVIELFMRFKLEGFPALLFRKILNVDVLIFSVFFVLFCFSFIDKKINQKLLFGLLISAGVISTLTFFSNTIISGIVNSSYGPRETVGPLYALYLFFLLFCFGVGLFFLNKTYRQTQSKDLRKQIGWIQVGAAFLIVLGTPTDVLFPIWNIEFLPLASFFSVIMAIFISYSLFLHDME
jgi:hypothetical protein